MIRDHEVGFVDSELLSLILSYLRNDWRKNCSDEQSFIPFGRFSIRNIVFT